MLSNALNVGADVHIVSNHILPTRSNFQVQFQCYKILMKLVIKCSFGIWDKTLKAIALGADNT